VKPVSSELRDDLQLVVATGWPTSSQMMFDHLLRHTAERALPLMSEVPDLIARLAQSEEDRSRARQVFLGALPHAFPDRMAVFGKAIARLAPPASDQAQARQALLPALADSRDAIDAGALANAITWLDPPAEERARVQRTLLDILASGHDLRFHDTIVRLAATHAERQRTRHALHELLADRALPERVVDSVAHILAGLNPGAEELEQARRELLARLAAETDPGSAQAAVDVIATLAVTVEDLAQARMACWASSLPRPTRNWPRSEHRQSPDSSPARRRRARYGNSC
jgi:hypothetical protein